MKAAQLLREIEGLLGSENRADAGWLLAHVLRTGPLEARLADLTEAQAAEARALAKRRLAGEPLQYITGVAGFYGRDFTVRPGVLIPRYDTEALVEAALSLLRDVKNPEILDLCTGSGILAVTLALERPDAHVLAADISEEALAVARENAAALGAANVRFAQGDLFAPVGGKFDLLISNPPYIPRGDLETLMREVREHEPRLALDGGADGLDFYRLIARGSPGYLRAGGWIALEFGDGQAEALGLLFAESGFSGVKIRNDLGGMPRVLTARPAEL